MYKAVEAGGDCVAVPRLLLAKLTQPGADDGRFRVGLYAVTNPQVDAQQAAQDLHLPLRDVERALEYWEGAGLLQKQAAPAPAQDAAPRRRMNTAQTLAAAGENAVLAGLVQEMQRIFGGVVSQADINIFTTLHVQDGFEADLILLAALHSVGEGKASARYIEKLLFGWQREGIKTCAQADEYLRRMEQQRQMQQRVAQQLGIAADGLTLAERRRINEWSEVYAYGPEMLDAARLAAGAQGGNIAYLNAILKKWHAQGYRTPRDVQQAQEHSNLRVQGGRGTIAPQDDVMLNTTGHVPLKQRRKER